MWGDDKTALRTAAYVGGAVGKRFRALRAYDGIGKFLFIFLISVSLLSQGAVNPVTLTIIACMFSLLGLGALVLLGEPRATASVFRLTIWFSIVLGGWVLVQTLPLEGLANPIWRDLGDFVNPGAATISIAPSDSLAAIVPLILPFVAFVCALVLFPTDDEAQNLLSYIGIIGGALAVWAVGEFLLSPRTLLLSDKLYYLDSLTAPFVNRNTAGTLYGVISLVLAARIYIDLRRVDFYSLIFNSEVARGKRRVDIYIILRLFLFLMSLVALFLTKSRGGVGATFVAYLVFVPLALYAPSDGRGRVASFRSDWRRPAWRLTRSLLGLFAVIAVGAVFADYALFRAESQGLADPRFCVAPAIFEAANNNKFTGVGFGTFRLFFPAYRDPHCGIIGVWDRAHSVYLEAYLGLGMVALAAVGFGVILLLYILCRGVATRRGLRIYPIAGISILLLVLGHSVIDFSVQIPGFAILFASIIAAILTISRGRSSLPATRQ